MPTKKYEDMEQAYQALTDIEIEDDKNNFPVAVIKVAGIHKIVIAMVNSWSYYKVLRPFQEEVLNYYINKLATTKNITDLKVLEERLKNFANEISSCKTKEDVVKKSQTLSVLFDEENIRLSFFKALKKMHIIHWWVTWKRYETKSNPLYNLIIFIFLWAFNFDGIKKKTLALLNKVSEIIQDTTSQLPIVSTNCIDLDTLKANLKKAHERERLRNSSKN